MKLPKGTRIAPLRYRLLAVGTPMGIAGAGTIAFMVGVAAVAQRRWAKAEKERPRSEGDRADAPHVRAHSFARATDFNRRAEKAGEWMQRPGVLAAFEVSKLLDVVRSRNRQSPIQRRLGLRQVDARTGGPVTVRSALIAYAVPSAWLWLTGRVIAPTNKPRSTADATAQLEAIKRAHPNDREAQARAMLELEPQLRRGCLRDVAWRLVPVLAMWLPALRSPLNQSLPDRLAGVIVVQDLKR